MGAVAKMIETYKQLLERLKQAKEYGDKKTIAYIQGEIRGFAFACQQALKGMPKDISFDNTPGNRLVADTIEGMIAVVEKAKTQGHLKK